MRWIQLTLLVALVSSVFACNSRSADATDPPLANVDDGELTDLFGIVQDHNGVTFQVYSGGCTSRDHFRVELDENGAIAIYRLEEDYCEAFVGMGATYTVTWAELGVDVMAEGSGYRQVRNPVNGAQLPHGNIVGYIQDHDGFTIQVNDSSGCTSTADFSVSVDRGFLDVTRDEPRTRCMIYEPYGRQVTFDWAAAGIEPPMVPFAIGS